MNQNLIIDPRSKKVLIPFKLDKEASVSIGLYQGDTLITTIVDGARYKKGQHIYEWDKKNQFGGGAVETGDYKITVVINDIQAEWEGVVGNTSTAKSGYAVHKSFMPMTDMYLYDGIGYYCTGYTEQTHSQFSFSTSEINTAVQLSANGVCNSFFVTGDGINIYWGSYVAVDIRLNPDDPANIVNMFFVFGINIATGERTIFSAGETIHPVYAPGEYSAFARLQTDFTHSPISAIAVQTTGDNFLIANKDAETLSVYDKATGALRQSLAHAGVKKLSIDADDNIWISTDSTVEKYSINTDGTINSLSISKTGLTEIKAISTSNDNNYLLIAEGGAIQRVNALSTTDGSHLWYLGEEGGYIDSPYASNNKFYFSDARELDYRVFISFQDDGSFWVMDAGNYRAQHYDTSKTFMDNIMFCPASYTTRVDKNDTKRVFIHYLEFEIDYSKAFSPSNGSWVLKANWGAKIPALYDNEFERLLYVNTLANSRTFACQKANGSADIDIVELTPAGLIFTDVKPGPFQLYPDGCLYRADNLETPGQPGHWYKREFKSFDLDGYPTWYPEELLVSSPPKTETNAISNSNNLTSGEILNNGVITFDGGNGTWIGSKGYHVGCLDIATNNWRWQTAYSTYPYYYGFYPETGRYDIGNGVVNAGGRCKVINDNIVVWNYHGEFWKQAQTNWFQLIYKNGLFLKRFGTDLSLMALNGENTYAAPMMAGNTLTIDTVIIGDDCYLYGGDESYHSGIHRWKITGLNEIAEINYNLQMSTDTVVDTLIGINLMDGLPFQSTLENNTSGWTRFPLNDYRNDPGYFDVWVVETNETQASQKSISTTFSASTLTMEADVYRTLLISEADSWRLTGQMSFENKNDNNGQGGMAMQILDETNKIIFELSLAQVLFPVMGLKINGNSYFDSDIIYDKTFYTNQYFDLTYSNDELRFTYAKEEPIILSLFDLTANGKRPSQLKLKHFKLQFNSYTWGITLTEMFLYVNNDSINS